jgi:hypothetical protein
VFVRRSDVAAENTVIDAGVDQYQREDEEARSASIFRENLVLVPGGMIVLSRGNFHL